MKNLISIIALMITLTTACEFRALGAFQHARTTVETNEDLIRIAFQGGYPGQEQDAIDVAMCESGLDHTAVSPTSDHGLFQINQVHSQWINDTWGWSMQDMLDPEKNVMVARALYNLRGWQPWYMSHDCHGLPL